MSERNHQHDLMPAPSSAMTASLADDQLLAIAEAAERRVEAVTKIKRLALRVTNARDWTDQGGHPYLQVSGAEKVARLFGISWRIDEPVREEDEDGHFSYTVKGYFTLGTAEIEVIGSRSSRDPFFARAKGKDIPPSEIDRNDVKKAAVTNCIGNGVTRLLGIRQLTWEDLAEAGLRQEDMGRVDYGSGAPAPAQATSYTIPFGRAKGKLLSDPEVSVRELEYQLRAVKNAIDDPAKAAYKAKNEAFARALEHELARRREGVEAEPVPVESEEVAEGDPPPSDQGEEDPLASYRSRIQTGSVAVATAAFNAAMDDARLTVPQKQGLRIAIRERLAQLEKGGPR